MHLLSEQIHAKTEELKAVEDQKARFEERIALILLAPGVGAGLVAGCRQQTGPLQGGGAQTCSVSYSAIFATLIPW